MASIEQRQIIDTFVTILHEAAQTYKDIDEKPVEEYINNITACIIGLRKLEPKIKTFFEQHPRETLTTILPNSYLTLLDNIMDSLRTKYSNYLKLGIIDSTISQLRVESDDYDSVHNFPESGSNMDTVPH